MTEAYVTRVHKFVLKISWGIVEHKNKMEHYSDKSMHVSISLAIKLCPVLKHRRLDRWLTNSLKLTMMTSADVRS
jgi:hypothetical protein